MNRDRIQAQVTVLQGEVITLSSELLGMLILVVVIIVLLLTGGSEGGWLAGGR